MRMWSIRFKFFFLGIITTSVIWLLLSYIYLNSTVEVITKRKLIPRYYPRNTVHANDIKWKGAKFPYKNENLVNNSIPSENDLLMMGVIREPEDQKMKDEGYHRHAFNLLISSRLGNHRALPDTRHSLCKKNQYNATLPQTSIIICFYNEALSTLLRTVHSIIDRTPNELIYEILLIDDYSESELIKPLEMYLSESSLPKVKLIRTPERAGLIRARTFGAKKATGEILLFLDSHCEVNQGWLEPLLERIRLNDSTVVCPIIDIINPDTFQYSASPIVKGGFNWGLHFKWDTVPSENLKKKTDFIKPIESPTMAGGLFAINRQFFHKIGDYDGGMDIWGGENLEISFRLWMCGGRLEIIPCSRVGHVFRHRRPYGSPNGEDTLTRNSLRVANVWMDEYKEYYFQTRPEVRDKHYGNIDDRVALRKSLKCHSFDWYIKTVYPELKLPKQKSKDKISNHIPKKSGQIFHRIPVEVVDKYMIQLSGTDLCIESEDEVTSKGSLLILSHCRSVKRQVWHETEKHDIRLAHLLCLDAGERFPRLYKCHEMGGLQDWRHSSNRDSPFYNPAAGLCLGVEKKQKGEHIVLAMCSSETSKKWDLRQQ